MAITTLANVKTFLGLTTTTKDALITMFIPMVESDFLRIRNKAFDTNATTGAIEYPNGSELTAIKMIAYLLYDSSKSGVAGAVKSESLSRHSITFAEVIDSYPAGLVSRIQKYDTLKMV